MVERTYGQLYLEVRDALLALEGAQAAAYMARQVLCHFSGLGPDQILARRDEIVPKEVRWEVRAATDRLLMEEPLAYVLGEWEFYGLPLHVTKDVYEDDIMLIQLRKRIVEIVDNHIDSGGYVNCAEIGNTIMQEMGGSIKYVDILGINGDKDLQTMKAVSPEVRPHLKTKLVLLDDGVTIDSDRGIDIETVINE